MVVVFFIPLIFLRNHGTAISLGIMMSVFSIVLLAAYTSEVTERTVARSEIDYARLETKGQIKVYVDHPKGSYVTTDAYIYRNIDDTSKVEIVLEETMNVWKVSPEYELKVQVKE